MTEVNVTDLRQNLPSWLDRARRGERIRITSRGAVIAEITGAKVTEQEAALIRERLRGAVTHCQSPAEAAHAPGEWSMNR